MTEPDRPQLPAPPQILTTEEPAWPSRYLAGWHKPAFILCLLCWVGNLVLTALQINYSRIGRWFEGLFVLFATVSTLLALGRRLPLQNVLATGVLIILISGVVISLANQNSGSVVQMGQELCQMAATNAKPRGRLILSEAGVPKLAIGQRVRFFFEAFPYQRYGVVNAKLDWISQSAVTSPEGAHFVALASLDQGELAARRRPLPLRVGMGGEASGLACCCLLRRLSRT
jgi:hypothetical protein